MEAIKFVDPSIKGFDECDCCGFNTVDPDGDRDKQYHDDLGPYCPDCFECTEVMTKVYYYLK